MKRYLYLLVAMLLLATTCWLLAPQLRQRLRPKLPQRKPQAERAPAAAAPAADARRSRC